MSENRAVPAIRFEGFSDEWERRRLGDFTTKVTAKNTGMSVTETFTNSAEYGVISQLDFFDHAVSKDESISGYTVVCPDDFVYNPRISVTAPVGPINRNRLNRTGVMSPLYTVFRTDESINRVYLEHFFRTSGWHSYMQLNGNSGARSDRFSIGDDTFFDMPIPAPSIAEQRKIAGFLENLDALIILYQRKYDKLVMVKKSMLEKMFPQGDAKVPEIRFAGFTGDWKQRKVGDITIESTEFATLDAGYPLLTSSRAGLMYQNEYRGNLTTDSKETLFSVVPVGACTYRHMSDDDVFHLNINTLEKGLVSREYPVFSASEENCLTFIVQHINSSAAFRAFCAEQKKGGTRTRLYYKALCEFEMMVPSKQEQEAIARYLHQLDTLITLHQRKLEKLKKIKASMLKKMFV